MYVYALKNTPRARGSDREMENNYRSLLSKEGQVLFDLELLETKRYFIDVEASRTVSVSVYNRELCYGGPEEGGWWYDWYSLETNERVPNNVVDVEQKIQELAARFPESENYYSVNGGHTYTIFVEYRAGSMNTTKRPRYE